MLAPLTSMHVDYFASCENIVSRLHAPSILPPAPTPQTAHQISLKKLFYSQY